ncbi:hypothetical protein FACS1894170_02840 [Planctomycetales bacterium]|nr:hypothetical protein FACS1894170_02840 [Planctomycetales bacterium]
MSDLCRITVKNGSIASVADLMVVTGYLVNFEPALPQPTGPAPLRDVLRPIEPDEPDPNIEVGYSRNVLEPLTIIYRNRKTELTKTLFILFRYCYDKYRAEGQAEFDFAEIAEVLTGDDCGMSKNAIEKAIRRLAESLATIAAPVSIRFNREILYIETLQQSKKL